MAAGVVYLVYLKDSPWSKSINRLLGVLRLVLFLLIFILLLGPLFNLWTQEIENPKVVIGIDHSESVANSLDSSQLRSLMGQIKALQLAYEKEGFDVRLSTLNNDLEDLDKLSFDGQETNISAWLNRVKANYEGQNLAEVVLFSDGNYNQGVSPIYSTMPFPLNTVGMGDTSQIRDLSIQEILYNKIAYQGNLYPVEVDVLNIGFEDERTKVQVWHKNKLLAEESIAFDRTQQLQKVRFEISAEESGIMQLSIMVLPLSEVAIQNNRQTIFVDVVDGKQNVLIAAPAPHPDIKAIMAAIGENENYEIEIYYPGQGKKVDGKYDLLIVHQPYDRYRRTTQIIEEMKKKDVPTVFIVGAQSRLQQVNEYEAAFGIKQLRNQRDQVTGYINSSFNRFNLDGLDQSIMSDYPPIIVPFGDYINVATDNVILFQRVGSVNSDKPLMYVTNQTGVKNAFLIGDNFWKWRLQEYALTEDTQTFDELVLKLVQYVSTKEDKRKLKCYPLKKEYRTNDNVSFQVEIYDEVYDRIYGQDVKFELSGPDGYTSDQIHTPYSPYDQIDVGGLLKGIYEYKASTELNGQSEMVRGKFIVTELNLEKMDQVADHVLLKQIAENSNGDFYHLDQLDELADNTSRKKYSQTVHSYEDVLSAINIQWLLILLLVLASLEWFIRKYSGGY